MQGVPVHLLHADIDRGWNWPRIGNFYKLPPSGHLVKQGFPRSFTVSDRWQYNGGKFASYYSESTFERREYRKSDGLAGLRREYDRISWTRQVGTTNVINAYGAWGNVFNSGRYYGRWDSTVVARMFPQPPASDSIASGRYHALTHLRSLSVTVSGYSVAPGAHARLGVVLSDTTTLPKNFATIEAAPYVDVSGNGTVRVDVHQAGKAYIILVAYFRDLEPPDQDGYTFNWMLNQYATAQFGIPSNAVAEFETEGEANQA